MSTSVSNVSECIGFGEVASLSQRQVLESKIRRDSQLGLPNQPPPHRSRVRIKHGRCQTWEDIPPAQFHLVFQLTAAPPGVSQVDVEAIRIGVLAEGSLEALLARNQVYA